MGRPRLRNAKLPQVSHPTGRLSPLNFTDQNRGAQASEWTLRTSWQGEIIVAEAAPTIFIEEYAHSSSASATIREPN